MVRFWKLFRPDGTPLPHADCPMAMALREKAPDPRHGSDR
jgi:hypothetical protein